MSRKVHLVKMIPHPTDALRFRRSQTETHCGQRIKPAKSPVRDELIYVADRSRGTVDAEALKGFARAMRDYPGECCEHCAAEFARIKSLYN